MQLRTSGGEMMVAATRCTGLLGGNFVTQNKKVVWALGIHFFNFAMLEKQV
jgi:hypothetical protein